jgi:tetratricopeptide (TPR) repeat protein
MKQENMQKESQNSHVPQADIKFNATEISDKMKKQFLEVYNNGVNLFSVGKYKEAKNKFLDCMIYGFESDKCLKSIASCCQMLEEYEDAMNFYKVALMYNEEENIDCYQFVGICAVKAKLFEEAVESLEEFLAKVGEEELENPERVKSAKMYLNIAKKKLEEKTEDK